MMRPAPPAVQSLARRAGKENGPADGRTVCSAATAWPGDDSIAHTVPLPQGRCLTPQPRGTGGGALLRSAGPRGPCLRRGPVRAGRARCSSSGRGRARIAAGPLRWRADPVRPGLDRGVFAELDVRVAPEMCPHFDGALVHPVYATWTLVYHMELTGRKLLAPHLEEHEEAVGAHISVDHRGMAALGSIVRIRAQVEQCTPHRLTTLMSAHCGARLLATGRFVQVIMPRHRLEALIQRHRDEA